MDYEADADGIDRGGGGDPEEGALNWTDAMMYCINERRRLDRKFTPKDIRHNPSLEEGAIDYLTQLSGDTGFAFLDDVVELVNNGKSLSYGQTSGTLNTMWVAFDRQRQQASTPKPREEISGRSHRADGMVNQVVPDGRYTVVHARRHHTFQLSACTYRDRRPGTQIISLLIGPDNTYNYKGFAFVVGSVLEPWSTSKMGRKVEDAAEFLLQGNFRAHGHMYSLKSNNCYRCGRPLTVPESILTGLGPDCARILGVLYGDLTPPSPEPEYNTVEGELIRKHYPGVQEMLDLQERGLPGTKTDRLATMYDSDYVDDRDDEDDGLVWRSDGPDEEE